MKVLVTGGAGFIGSHIVDELLNANYEVVIVDNLTSGQKRNIRSEAKFYEIDIRNNLDEIFEVEQPQYVIHHAAQVSVSQSMLQPVHDGKENIIGTINLLETCVKYKVKKFIFASTAAVYGEPKYLPIDENHPLNPLSFYGLSKLQAEAYIQFFSTLYELDYTILRYANVYGMRQNSEGEAGVIAIFIDHLLKEKAPIIYGDGLQTRDFIFVKDIAKANVAALKKGSKEIINISTNTEISVLEIVKELSTHANRQLPIEFADNRTGDIRHSYLCNEKAKQLLSWEPRCYFRKGLIGTINYYSGLINHFTLNQNDEMFVMMDDYKAR